MSKKIKEQMITWLEEQKQKAFTVEEISRALGLEESQDFKLLVQTLAAMEREKVIEFTRQGKIKLPLKQTLLEGTFRANERGFGFVALDGEEEEVYIAPDNVQYALDGDRVKIDIIKVANPFEDRQAEGKIVEIVERAATQLIGEFYPYSKEEIAATDLYGYVLPKDKKLSKYQVMIATQGLQPLAGEICIVELTHYPEKGYAKSFEGIVKKVVGHKDDPGMDILTIVMKHGIPTEFEEDVLAQAEAVPQEPQVEDFKGRRDLRDQMIVTIDGEDAKDLDDAVTVRKLKNGHYFLGVHIADVSYYVTENSPLDQEAFERGTSVYLTDRVIPMLPRRLSNGICSLNPQVPRLTLSCEMEVDQNGQVVNYDIFPSVIQTTERMTYTAVNEILEEQNPETMERYQELVPMFQAMAELHGILEKMRKDRGALAFEDHEARVIVDEEGTPQEIVMRSRGLGERLIESFMLLANETVARHFYQAKLPFIYRIHEQPKAEKMQRFFEFATNFGLLIKGNKEDISPKALQQVLAEVAGKPEEMVINTMLLRSMQQARYADEPKGHYGLAATDYTHFTSPIRRYPDLIVHRLIRSYQANQDEATKEKWAARLPEIADHSSKMERRAVEAEREADLLKKAEFMQMHIGEEFDGIISSVTKFGLFVELPNTIEGLIHVNQLKNDYFHYLEKHLALVGERTGVVYKIGQKVTIRVTKADPETREIDFELIQAETIDPSIFALPKKLKKGNRSRSKDRKTKAKLKDQKSGKSKETAGYKKKSKKNQRPFYKAVAKKQKTGKKKS